MSSVRHTGGRRAVWRLSVEERAAASAEVAAGGGCVGGDSDEWFPDHADSFRRPVGEVERAESLAAAEVLCWGCPVQAACLSLAVDGGEWFGVWGGLPGWRIRRLARSEVLVRDELGRAGLRSLVGAA
ncbi:MAG: WhiB family transcriptional regulator [Dermatophilaceae bacterium]